MQYDIAAAAAPYRSSCLAGTETIVCDGWSAYNEYTIQLCRSHIIREPHHLSEANPDRKDARHMLEWLRRIYADVKKKRQDKARQKAHDLLVARVKRPIAKYRNNLPLAKFMANLKNALPNLFTFVLYTRIPATNNAAERGLREIVVHRKIRGSLRVRIAQMSRAISPRVLQHESSKDWILGKRW